MSLIGINVSAFDARMTIKSVFLTLCIVLLTSQSAIKSRKIVLNRTL
jgi:hypothetical protein